MHRKTIPKKWSSVKKIIFDRKKWKKRLQLKAMTVQMNIAFEKGIVLPNSLLFENCFIYLFVSYRSTQAPDNIINKKTWIFFKHPRTRTNFMKFVDKLDSLQYCHPSLKGFLFILEYWATKLESCPQVKRSDKWVCRT